MGDFNSVFISLGTNLGDKLKNLDEAEKLISEKLGEIVLSSSRIETNPLGFESENTFINSVLKINTSLSPEKLLKLCKEIEIKLGRLKKSNLGVYSDRLIDIDILYFNSEIHDSLDLTIPHSKIQERDFVLKPLCQIAPYYIHPLLNKSNFELLNSLTEKELKN